MATKKNSAPQLLLVLILGAVLGSGGMYVSKPKLSNNYATVIQNNNLLVFIASAPVNNNYEVLEEVQMDNLFEITQAGNAESGKGKFWKKLLDIGANAYQNISFGERVNKFSQEAKSEYPNADAIIVSGDFRTASVIKFKQ